MTDELLSQIREALAEGADDVTRQRGVNACRNLLAVLGAKPGEPMETSAPAMATATAAVSPLAHAVASAPPTAILDAVIAKLKARLPSDAPETEPAPQPVVLRIPFIPIPNVKGK